MTDHTIDAVLAGVRAAQVRASAALSSRLSRLSPRDREDTARALRLISKKFGTAADQTPPPIEVTPRGMFISNVGGVR